MSLSILNSFLCKGEYPLGEYKSWRYDYRVHLSTVWSSSNISVRRFYLPSSNTSKASNLFYENTDFRQIQIISNLWEERTIYKHGVLCLYSYWQLIFIFARSYNKVVKKNIKSTHLHITVKFFSKSAWIHISSWKFRKKRSRYDFFNY